MTTLDPIRTDVAHPPRPAGPWAWLLERIRSWLAATPARASGPMSAAGIAARVTGLGGQDRQGAYVVAPCGYRIRVPGPDAQGGKVGQMLPAVKQGLDLVPPLPHVVASLLREVQDARATAASVAAIAAHDPSLAAGLLRTVNSSAFGLTRKVTAVSEAVSYIGFTAVKSMVLRLQLDRTLGVVAGADAETAADVEDVWVHSLVVSHVADALAERVGEADRGFAATLGLLHDLGKLVVLSRFPGEARRLRAAPTVANEGQLDRESRILGVDHAALGANLAGRWGLPGDLVRAIRYHHAPERAFEPTDPKPLRQALALVQVANQLAKYFYVYQDRTELDAIAPATFELLGLGRDLPALLTPAVREAAGKAVLFADDGNRRPPTVVRRFLRLTRGDAAAALLASAGTSPRQQVEVDDVDSAALFTGASDRDVLHAPADAAGVKRLAADLVRAQAALPIPDAARPVVAMLSRTVLANAIVADGPGDEVAEVVHAVADGRVRVAVRCPTFSFARRFGPAADPDACLAAVDAELANVLNLGWCESITVSSDGGTLVFTVKG